MQNKGKLVLVVEDEPALQEAVKFKLESKGIEVITADTGEEALELLKTNKPDLIWLDNILPGMQGLEVLERIRHNPNIKDLAVVIVSVTDDEKKIKQAFKMKVVDYIVKTSYKLDGIINKVDIILSALPPS